MAKAPCDIRSLARTHTATAIRVLAGIMREPKAPHAARVAAASALLDRGWGRPQQDLTLNAGDSLIEFLAQLETSARRAEPMAEQAGDVHPGGVIGHA